jgi:uncharacterized protein involved in exopolysaccharide biosynthesis
MAEAEWDGGNEISLFEMGAIVLRSRWRIVRWVLIGATVAALSVITKPPFFFASASFITQGNDPSRSGLTSLAGQFGVSLPSGSPSLSPDFYSKLLKSPVLLRGIARDTFVVPELGGKRKSFLDLFDVRDKQPRIREERGVILLTGLVTTNVVKTTGVVEVSVLTRWPSVSLGIITALMNGLNDFNLSSRQGQAAAERRFVEGRLTLADAELRAAEDRLEGFLRMNRVITSPELTLERDRLQRDVSMRQQVYTSLAQSYEEVRMREVRDTPVITVVEPPSVRPMHEPRGIVRTVIVGGLLGTFIGMLIGFISGIMAHRRRRGVAGDAEFVETLREMKGEMLTPARWIRSRIAK